MAFIDCVEWKPQSNDVYAWRFPEDNLSTAAQVIVRESQEAVFFSKGQILDKLGPGKHSLKTENLPLLRGLYGLPFGKKNPFTAEIDLRLQPNYANNDSIKWIVSTLKTYQGVRDIDYRQDLIDSVNKNLSKISIVLLILAAILTIESFSLINNTIRLSVYSRRFSIHTMKLVGASYNFIRAPFLRSAIGQGLLSALIAIIVLGIGVYALYCYEPDMTVVLNTQVMIITAAAVLLFGILITLFCSWLSVNKFLKMKAADLYKI